MNRPLSTLVLAAVTALAVAAGAVPARAQSGVQFDGTNDFITFGQATATLGAPTFTLECWFRRTGGGAITSTGTGGVTNAIPLLTKGRGEAEMTTADCNYFMGIRQSDSVLVADYEEGTGQLSPGLNHPIAGVTPIRRNVWYHGAVTFDGTTLRLFLNGRLEATVVVGAGRLPQWLSVQHAGLASAMTTAGTSGAAGFFAGTIDEARIWDHARPEAGIRDSASLELTSGAGLLGRWGLNTGSGTTATNSIGGSPNGTLTNGPTWVTGSPFRLADALQFNGSTDYATFGDPSALDLVAWTVECWFRRDGAGNAVSTGATGGVTAVPMVTHGAPESDNSTLDMNWYLGLRGSDFVLAADFEESGSGTTPGLNHSIVGTTTVATGAWHHAAMTYDGNEWRLYLDGGLENSLVVGQPAQSNTTQPASLATAHRTTGAHQGFFNGALDEVRVWSGARSQGQIQAEINNRIAVATPGLVARWSLDEAADSLVNGSAGTTVNGTVRGTNWAWVQGAPFNAPTPPTAPSGLFASAVNHQQIHLSWFDNSTNETAFDIERSTSGPGGPFTPLASLGANATGYDDLTAAASTPYCYQVKSRNAAGSSGFDAPACATTPSEPNLALDFAGATHVGFGDPAALDLPQFTIECWFKREAAGTPGTTGAGGVIGAIPLLTKGRNEVEDPDVDMNWWLGIRDTLNVLAADFEEGAAGDSSGLNHPIYGTTVITNNVWHHAAATYDGTAWHLYLDGHLEASLVVGQPVASASTQQVAIASALRSDGTAAGFFNGVIDEARVWSVARTRGQIQSTINTPLATPAVGLVARWGLNEAVGTSVFNSAGPGINGTISGANYTRVTGAPFDLDFIHAIAASAGAGGSITPPGVTPVNDGDDQGFTIVGNAGYSITSLDVDGAPIPPTGAYTFTNVTADHTIAATFADVTAPTVAVTSPNGGETVIIGSSAELTWTATDPVDVTLVNLLLSRNGAAGPWEVIATSISNTGSYLWTVSGPYTEEALLRVEARDPSANWGTDDSDEVFTIEDAPTATLLALFESETVDEGVRLRWRMGDASLFKLVNLERAENASGPWKGVIAETRSEQGTTIALDRGVEDGRTYHYRLTTTYEGARIVFGPIAATAGVQVRESAITSIVPNPSSGPIRISYALKAPAAIRVSIHDIQGRELAVLAAGEASAGRHQAVWSGATDRGPAAAGVYYVRVTAGDQTFVKRVVLAR